MVRRSGGGEPGEAGANETTHPTEGTRDQHAAIGLECEGRDGTVGLRIEGRVAGAVAIEANGETSEGATDNNATVGLESDRVDRGGGTVKGGEGRVVRAIGIETRDDVADARAVREDENAAVGLGDESADDTDVRSERGISGPVGEEAREVRAGGAVDRCETTADDDEGAVIGLDDQGVDGAGDVRAVSGIE